MARANLEIQAHNNLTATARNVRMFEGSDASLMAIEMLDALIASYCLDLMSVSPEGLVRVQSALQQTSAIRAVFANDGIDTPKI